MSLNLYKNLPNQINTNDEKYNLVKNNLLNNTILQNELQLHLTNFKENNEQFNNYELFNTYLKDKLIHKTIVQWFNIREVEHALYILTVHPPNTRYTRPLGSWSPYYYY